MGHSGGGASESGNCVPQVTQMNLSMLGTLRCGTNTHRTSEVTVPPTQHQKAAEFRALHDGEPFVIPNPWDAGSARVLEALGFKALATTSSGFAFTLGRLDGATTLDEVAEHVAALCDATALPVSVDLENGYGPEP